MLLNYMLMIARIILALSVSGYMWVLLTCKQASNPYIIIYIHIYIYTRLYKLLSCSIHNLYRYLRAENYYYTYIIMKFLKQAVTCLIYFYLYLHSFA